MPQRSKKHHRSKIHQPELEKPEIEEPKIELKVEEISEEEEEIKPFLVKPMAKPGKISHVSILMLGVLLFLLGIQVINLVKIKWQQRQSQRPVAENPFLTGQPEKATSPIPTIAEKEIDYVQLADSVTIWMDGQKNDGKEYSSFIRCNDQGECRRSMTDRRAGIMAAWAYYNRYKLSKDAQDLEKIAKILDYYSFGNTRNTAFDIQNVFWDCKFFYEFYESGFFSEEQKKQIYNICLKQSSYNPTAEELVQESEELPALDFLSFIQSRPPVEDYKDFIAESYGDDTPFIRYCTYASDYVYKYYLSGHNVIYINEAKIYFNQGVKYWAEQPLDSYLYGRCFLGIAALDLYRSSGSQKYLEFAEEFSRKERIEDLFVRNPEKPVIMASYFNDSALEQASCALFYKKLFGVTANEVYKRLENSIIGQLVENNFDLKGYPGYKNGLGAFYSQESSSLFYSIKENSLILQELVEK